MIIKRKLPNTSVLISNQLIKNLKKRVISLEHHNIIQINFTISLNQGILKRVKFTSYLKVFGWGLNCQFFLCIAFWNKKLFMESYGDDLQGA